MNILFRLSNRIDNKFCNYYNDSKVILHILKSTIKYLHTFILMMDKKECALCGTIIQESTNLNLCNKCIGCADCCIGLEKL